MGLVSIAPRLAPGVPADYYERIHRFELDHFWYRRIRDIGWALAGERLGRPRARVFDGGCGTGGFLSWVLDRNPTATVAGIDIGAAAVELARERVPQAVLRVAPLSSIPFEDCSFDVVVTNDVLQHVAEPDVLQSLRELRRLLEPDGALLVRTNGSRRLRRERADWRAYDRQTLRYQLEQAGFRVERITHANLVASLWATARGRVPHAPTETSDGIPQQPPSKPIEVIGNALLRCEAAWLHRPRATLPYGFSIFALASRVSDGL
jgi:ubiquinone/menaquinone biosynthesis C-methylase UbiE